MYKQFLSEIENSLENQRFQSKFNDSDEDEYDDSNYNKKDGFYIDGLYTQEWFEKYKHNQLVNVNTHNIITEEQFSEIMDSTEIRTYIHLRETFRSLKIKNVKKLMDSLYKQIKSIIKERKTDSEKARLIQDILSKSLICRYIPKSKEELLIDATNLGLSVNENSSKESICYALLGALVVTEKNSAFIKQMEKMFFNPNKKGLPDKLSDMTPREIAQVLIRDIKALSGPISGALLVPKPEFTDILGREPPVFMLLGDWHVGNQECQSCPRDGGCYSLYNRDPTFLKYLSNLAKDTNLSIDLFLEGWVRRKYMISNSFVKTIKDEQDSALTDITHLTKPCVGQRKEMDLKRSCFFTEFRTHSANPRHGHDYYNKYVADTILDFFRLDTTGDMLKDFEKTFPDFTFDDIMGELISLYSAKDNVESLTRYFESPFFKKYSRTLHEFNKLPSFLQRSLKQSLFTLAKLDTENRYMMCHYYKLDKRTEESFEEMLQWLTEGLKYYVHNKNEKINDKIKSEIINLKKCYDLSLGGILVDIYTISRALKGFDGGLPCQLSVVYQGHAHIINQIELLQDYYDVVKTWGKPDISLGVKQIKCITQNP